MTKASTVRPTKEPEVPPIVRTAMIMGLPFSVHLRRPAGAGGNNPAIRVVDGAADLATLDAAVNQMWEELRWADRVFSPYRPDSDISRIRDGLLKIGDADPAVGDVLDLADTARRLTGGTFDVYGGDLHGHRVRDTRALDPSGIVKSWAAARAATRLSGLGLDFYLNAGGDVQLRSSGPDQPWRIGIEHPDDPRGLLAVVQLPTGAVATSGRTHRGEHIWDPGTGQPARGIAQATVIGPSLIWADVLATATVAGGVARMDRAQWPPGHEVLLVTDDGSVLASAGFPPFFADDVPVPPYRIIG